ncbi:TetR/AcrR family transcriptional regulator [Gordonia bronchialis]|uniref:TetR/AcrR family transcriptional regulator n=1 Tax=Gordonia bronchialis TaxID=2054 RepID=UPI00226D40C6|nr:TetR/AcrR family transcriptional regulator [Gordonia bronchialis]
MGSVTRATSDARRRRAEVTERVLAAVEQLLADGERFTEIPVQRIAERSGMSRPAFYQYFPDKSDVLIRVADVAAQAFFAGPPNGSPTTSRSTVASTGWRTPSESRWRSSESTGH